MEAMGFGGIGDEARDRQLVVDQQQMGPPFSRRAPARRRQLAAETGTSFDLRRRC
jgi:hypothetical protein